MGNAGGKLADGLHLLSLAQLLLALAQLGQVLQPQVGFGHHLREALEDVDIPFGKSTFALAVDRDSPAAEGHVHHRLDFRAYEVTVVFYVGAIATVDRSPGFRGFLKGPGQGLVQRQLAGHRRGHVLGLVGIFEFVDELNATQVIIDQSGQLGV